MSTSTTFKRGDTFSMGCAVLLGAGTWAAACKLRNQHGDLIETVSCTLTPPVAPATDHQLLLEVPATNTAAWPLETLYGDVQFTDSAQTPNIKATSGSFTLVILEPLTR